MRSTHITAELIRREADGGGPANSSLIDEEDRFGLACIGFECPLTAVYKGTCFAAADL